jgi:hypothetical protein
MPEPLHSSKLGTRHGASVAQFAKAHSDGRLDDRLIHFGKPKLLIVDEDRLRISPRTCCVSDSFL